MAILPSSAYSYFGIKKTKPSCHGSLFMGHWSDVLIFSIEYLSNLLELVWALPQLQSIGYINSLVEPWVEYFLFPSLEPLFLFPTVLCPGRLTCMESIKGISISLASFWNQPRMIPGKTSEGRKRVRMGYLFPCFSSCKVTSGWLHPLIKSQCSCLRNQHLEPSRCCSDSLSASPRSRGWHNHTAASSVSCTVPVLSPHPTHTFVP